MSISSKFIAVIVLVCSSVFGSNAQNKLAINDQIIQNYFQPDDGYSNYKRSFIKPVKKIAPVQWLAGGLIYFYQNVVSEQLQAGCTYQISCSQYIKLCIQQYGFAKGTFAGLHQFIKCANGNHNIHLPFKINDDSKIMNQVSDEICK